ncbi:hypothetical protein EDC04DRAFT_2564573, partial [Pisolithus marmoratus]
FTVDDLLNMIGVEIAKVHLADIIHGDLTNSNMMLRKGSKIWSVPIYFGLAHHSTMVEDKAVGLYVLEHAFGSNVSRRRAAFQLSSAHTTNI